MPYSTIFLTTGDDLVRLERAEGNTWRARTLLEGIGAQCVAVDPTNPRRIYVGTFDEGLHRSLDAGETWAGVSAGIAETRVMSVAFAPARSVDGVASVYAGTEPSAIYRSEDDGATWIPFPSLQQAPSQPTWSFPPRPWTSHVRWMAAHPRDPDIFYAGIELGGVMITRDAGETWEDRKPGSYHDCHALATHPLAPDRIYEAAGEGVAWSDNAGLTWQPADEGLRHRYVWALAVDPADPSCWYVSAASGAGAAHRSQGNAGAGLYRKRGSNPWELICGGSSGLPESLPFMPYALITVADRPGLILTAFQHGEFWESVDHGASWARLSVDWQGSVLQAVSVGSGPGRSYG
jgi:photosystem II stability/assembly factor-like uncharacterized protein